MDINVGKNRPIYRLVVTSLIAAVYTVMSLLGAAYSFSNIQIRFAEILCLLPIVFPGSIWGVTLGCFITNLLGTLMGINPIGVIDMVFGTAATLLAAYLTYRWRGIRIKKLPLLAAFAPVIVNGIIIGIELTYVYGAGDFALFPLFAIEVAAGEFIACVLLGIPVIMKLEQHGVFRKL